MLDSHQPLICSVGHHRKIYDHAKSIDVNKILAKNRLFFYFNILLVELAWKDVMQF